MNLALIGFMGTGKTTVGRLLARYIDYEHLDTDTWIEAQAATGISTLFATEGEAAFREREHTLIVSLEHRTKLLISTGGGLFVDPRNRQSLRKHARTVCLHASPATLLQRVSAQGPRPLLQVPDPLGRIRELLAQRAEAYQQADLHVDTEAKTSEEVAQEILGLLSPGRPSPPPAPRRD